MKRALYVSLIFAMVTSAPLAAQRTKSPVRTVKQVDMISTLAAAPASAWDAFIAMLLNAQRRLTINDGPINPPDEGDPTISGVITEPVGVPQAPPPSQP